MSTVGRLHFRLEDAKEFCLKIAAGEIDTEELLAEFAAEAMAAGTALGFLLCRFLAPRTMGTSAAHLLSVISLTEKP